MTEKLKHCPDQGAMFFTYAGCVEKIRREGLGATHRPVGCEECGKWHVVPGREEMRSAA